MAGSSAGRSGLNVFWHSRLSGDRADRGVGNKVEAAYRRGDLFMKRKQMMEDWAAFVSGEA